MFICTCIFLPLRRCR